MRSSTSNSDLGSRRRAARRCLVWAGATASLMLLAGIVFWRTAPREILREWLPEAFQGFEVKPDEYLALYRTEAIDHYVHFHGTDPEVVRSMRSADVLLTGTSRMMLGFDERRLGEFFRGRRMRHYMLGFAYGETAPFTRAVLERADLRPRWVIANTDGFFYPRPSRYGWEVMHSSWANAWQVGFETRSTFEAISTMHRWLPYLAVDRTRSVWMRSREDGGWRPHFVPHAAKPFEPPVLRGSALTEEVLGVAREFKAAVEARGAKLVLTFVPTPAGYRAQGEALATALEVPWVAPDLRGLESYDGSHLTAASAEKFTEAFLIELATVLGDERRQ